MVVRLVEDLACVEEEPKPWAVQWDLGDEEGRVLEVVGPDWGVGDQGEGHNLEEGGLEVRVPLVAGQTDQGREQEEVACHHGLEDQRAEGGRPCPGGGGPGGPGGPGGTRRGTWGTLHPT